MKDILKMVYGDQKEVKLESQKIELASLNDLRTSINILQKAEELSREVFDMYDKAVKEAQRFSKEHLRVQKELADIGSDIEVKVKELGLPIPKEVQEADKLLDKSFKTLSKLQKIAKG